MSTDVHPLVMIVDDNEANLALGKVLVEMLGYEVITVLDGRQALSMFETCYPAAVLMDIKMPCLDGLEAMRGIRALEHKLSRLRVPVIAWTACEQRVSEPFWQAAGGDGFLPKPVTPERLKQVLDEQIGKAGRQQTFDI
jgi:CheY-like chemotaxis protein